MEEIQPQNRQPFAPKKSTWLTRMLTLIPLQLKDAVIHSRTARNILGLKLCLQALVLPSDRSAALLCQAYGYSSSIILDNWIVHHLKKAKYPLQEGFWAPMVKDCPRYRTLLEKDPALTRSIILKAPGPGGEKGVLLMYFEYNWARLAIGLPGASFDWLDKNFDLVLSTSWSPTDYITLNLLLSKTSGPLFVQPCNYLERDKLSRFHHRIIALDSLPCDWINPSFYQPPPLSSRDIDILMVANWGEFKRHWDFFNALRQLPSEWRVVLVGQKEGGRDAEFIARLANKIGVPQKLEIFQSIPISVVSSFQQRARVSLIFTRREGCCVASVESLFAGCAVGMRSDAHIGPLAYLHQQTGKQLRPGHLAQDIAALHQSACPGETAMWAKSHISCEQTLQKLAQTLKTSAQARQLPWIQELTPVQWRPYPCHIYESDKLALSETYHQLHSRYPKIFNDNLADTSNR